MDSSFKVIKPSSAALIAIATPSIDVIFIDETHHLHLKDTNSVVEVMIRPFPLTDNSDINNIYVFLQN